MKKKEATLQPPPRRTETPSWLKIIIAVQLVLFAWQFTPILSTNGDNAKYLILGKALTEGRGYRQLYMPNEPVESQYPVVFPAILAVTQALSSSFVFSKVFVSLCGIIVTLLCYVLFSRSAGYLLLPLVILVAGSGIIAEYSVIVMSEVPYLLFSLLALVLLEKSRENPRNALLFWTTIIVSALPINTRTIGLAFSAAWIADNLLNKHYRYAIAHAAVCIAAIVLFRLMSESSNSYIVHLLLRNSYDPDAGFATVREMVLRIWVNLDKYGSTILRGTMVPFAKNYPFFLGRLISTVCVVLALIGWTRTFFVGKRMISLYLFFYAGILLMWQEQWSSERFLISVLPFLFLFMLYGFDALWRFFEPAEDQHPAAFFKKLASVGVGPAGVYARRSTYVMVAIIILFNVQYHFVRAGQNKNLSADWNNYYSCADWARIHTPPDAVFMSRKPEMFYMRALRKGLNYPFTHNVDKIIETMEKEGVTHIIYDNFAWTRTTAKYLYPVIVGHPDKFRIVYALKNPDTFVLEFVNK